jgi:nucleoside-diphosphate-sugar epimerase
VSLPLQRSIVAASGDARLVVLDNLYMYGRSDGPLREDTPVRPCSKKGSLRAQLAEELLSCGRSVAIARASDFLGPSLTGSFLGAPFWSKVKAGKPVDVLGDPDLPHAFTYTPDVAEALALLGEHDDEGVFHVPSIDTTLRAVVDAYARSLGVTIALRRVPAWVLAAASPFSPLLREVREMAYLWREPLRVDASKLTARFGLRATSLERAVATSLAAA